MIESIHQSSLNMALRCGEQFRRRYIEDEIIPPGIGAGRGTAVHKANEVNLSQKIKSEQDLPLDDLKDACRDGYVRAFENGVYLPKEEIPRKSNLLNDGLNEALLCTELYHAEVAPEIQPIEVERKFLIDVGLPLALAGMIDIEREKKVDDLKTSKMKWPENRIQQEIQPVFYSFVHEKETGIRPEFVYHILRVLKSGPQRQVQKLTPTDNHYNALFAKLHMFIKMLDTGTFLPANPTSWWCTEKWCGYYPTCEYVGNGKNKKWI